MGAYLNKPVTDKETESGGNGRVKYGATSMQGWRVNQEDAHNAILDLHEEWAMFAVYDGHGGSEVSKYVATHFPEFLKKREFWSSDDLASTLQSAFVDFDDVIRSEEVMKELKVMGGKPKRESEDEDGSEDGDRARMYEEGGMPLEALLHRYGYALVRKDKEGGKALIKELVEEANAMKEDEEEDAGEGKVVKRPCGSPINKEKDPKRVKTEDDTKENEVVAENGDAKPETEKDVKPNADAANAEVSSSDDEDYDNDQSENEEDEGDDEEEDEEEEESEADEEGMELMGPGMETPGDDSGTTACVCLLGKGRVVVANAGDSRAVLSRAGKAVDLSIDHKPEDEIEKKRIERAGGCVNEDGRVNGGLNLSRALGDHCYKKNTELPLAEQMISALPDIHVEDLTPEDTFIVVACDGIWNSMESQQVVDFVKERLEKGMATQDICEEMCTHCLADSTEGDGTGCDNMTVIIADLRPAAAAITA